VKKYLAVLFLLLPLLIQSQTFKSYGIKTGHSFDASGWEHPDTLGNNYHNKAYISTFSMGLFGEFFGQKYFNGMIDLGYKWRQFFFQYDLGNPNDNRDIRNAFNYFTLAITEKVKVESGRWNVHMYAGVKTELMFSKNIERDIQNIFENSKSLLYGFTAGAGFSKRFSQFWRISFDVYFERDLTKMYESNTGFIRNQEIGVKIGVGPYNPAKK